MSIKPIPKLVEYLSVSGRMAALVRSTGLSQAFIWQIANGHRRAPIARCNHIESGTGGEVTRRDLRPEDWHLIWPDLAATEQ